MDKATDGLEAKIQEEFLSLANTQCPYLGDDKRCLIYDVRPLVCRAMGVTRTPAVGCRRPIGLGETMSTRRYVPDHAAKMLREAVDVVLDAVPKPTWAMAGFLPGLLVGLARPNEYRNCVENGLVSTAKILVTSPSMGILWQEQVETTVKKDIGEKLSVG